MQCRIRGNREQDHRHHRAPSRRLAVVDRRPVVVEDLVGLVHLVDEQHEARVAGLLVRYEHVDAREISDRDGIRAVESAAQLYVEAFGFEAGGDDSGPERAVYRRQTRHWHTCNIRVRIVGEVRAVHCRGNADEGAHVERRIFGLENEYGVTCTLRGQRRLSPDEVARYLFRRVVSWGRSSNVFLENGARLYLDVGSHPEYATPECDSIYDLVVHDKAGERILESLVQSAEQRLREEGIRGEVFLFKNNTDSAGNSYGCHENYLVERDGDFSKFTDVLIPFLVSRQVYAGAGKVLQTARGAMYCIAQRAEHIWEGVSSATTRSRPIINTRDEPHADAERFRRLHVIVGDSNMSEYATFLKVGATSIILRMLEEDGAPWRDLTLENPIRAIREISHDITCRRRVRLANGRELSAVEIQGEYLTRALRFAKRRGLPPLEKQALEMWEHVMTHLEQDPLKLTTEVDWVIKYHLIESYRKRGDLPLTHPRVALLDLAYHDVTRARSLYYLLERREQVERIVTDDEIATAVTTPPQTTRARLRGAFIKRAKERKRDYTVDWVHLKLNDQAQRTVLCKDPFKARDERVERLIASL
jgi:proteasome accessory factor A